MMSKTPEGRMGVYRRLEDVPDRYRLKHYREEFEGRDVWREFVVADRYPCGDRLRDKIARVERRWKAHIADRGRHHALATPADVESFLQGLDEAYAMSNVYLHWLQLELFYDWLQWNPDFPHVYHPVLMAAAEGGVAAAVWEYKTTHD